MIKILTDTFNISEEEATLFFSCFEDVKLLKGDKFLTTGKVSTKVGFVKSGILKCSLIGKHKEVVDDFIFENQFVANYSSFLTKKTSTKEIVCLTDCELWVASKSKIEALGSQYSFMAQMAQKIAEQLFIATHQKLENLRLLSAKERYSLLLKTNTKLLQKIPQYEIASYLNVTPETVSRIKKELLDFY